MDANGANDELLYQTATAVSDITESWSDQTQWTPQVQLSDALERVETVLVEIGENPEDTYSLEQVQPMSLGLQFSRMTSNGKGLQAPPPPLMIRLPLTTLIGHMSRSAAIARRCALTSWEGANWVSGNKPP